jgi:magnesium chelatase family protein
MSFRRRLSPALDPNSPHWSATRSPKARCALCLRHPRLYPCACGYFGDRKRECRCSPKQVENYRNKISGPLLDRIDIHVEAPAVEYKELSSTERAEPSAAIRDRVIAARKIQQERFSENRRCRANAEMSHNIPKTHCHLDAAGQEIIRHAMEELRLSARA